MSRRRVLVVEDLAAGQNLVRLELALLLFARSRRVGKRNGHCGDVDLGVELAVEHVVLVEDILFLVGQHRVRVAVLHRQRLILLDGRVRIHVLCDEAAQFVHTRSVHSGSHPRRRDLRVFLVAHHRRLQADLALVGRVTVVVVGRRIGLLLLDELRLLGDVLADTELRQTRRVLYQQRLMHDRLD